MKRLLFGIVALFFVVMEATAQTSLSSGAAEISAELKRTIAQGHEVTLDFIITCHASNWALIFFSPRFSQVYDDEGNYYEGEKIRFVADNDSDLLHVERDIPRKMKIVIKDVDEYATSFRLCKIKYSSQDINGRTIKEDVTMTIKELPFQRP